MSQEKIDTLQKALDLVNDAESKQKIEAELKTAQKESMRQEIAHRLLMQSTKINALESQMNLVCFGLAAVFVVVLVFTFGNLSSITALEKSFGQVEAGILHMQRILDNLTERILASSIEHAMNATTVAAAEVTSSPYNLVSLTFCVVYLPLTVCWYVFLVWMLTQ